MFENITEEQLESMIVKWHDDNLYSDDEYDCIADNISLIEKGDDRADHKTVYTDTIYNWHPTNQFYCVTTSRSNSGYWGDSERYGTKITKVVPKEVTKTIYVKAK